ncbi:MAG TPA: ABC transporter ATP-binding protein, partial [Verrucomicrobiales bacterium]|nr:ABC transporter ATP-binding protein [Verrucomicrobiales bacterium]
EVERVANRVAILHRGRLLATGTLSALRDTHRRWRVRGVRNGSPPGVPGLLQHSLVAG